MQNFKPINLLLVDDDDIDIVAFQRALSRTGLPCNIDVCKDAEEAMIVVIENTYDCMFFDYLLPGIDGLALLKKVRALGITSPVAVLTSQGDEKLAVEIMKAGAFDYFPKSEVDPDKLSRIITTSLRLNQYEKEKKEAEKALIENNNKLNAIIESTKSLIFAFDCNFTLTACNSIFREKIKQLYQLDVSLGYNITDIFKHSVNFHVYENYFNRAFACEHFSVKEELGNPHIETHFYQITFNPVKNDSGVCNEIAVYATSIEEEQNAQLEVLKAKLDAERTAKAKSEFLSNMSHEIRTPMNAIIGLSEILLKEKLTKKQLDNLQSIKYSADNLLVIINDILDFSKIESGKVEFENIEFDLIQKMQEIIKTFNFKASEKGLHLICDVDSKMPKSIVGDPYRLNQIILNLMSNGLKFTEQGGVTLKVEILRENETTLDLLISVIDTGIGIPRDKLESVFESYTQAYTDTTRKFGGTGLGLAITRQLVLLQNGEIMLDSEVGKGTTFSVRIPFMKCNQNTISISESIVEDEVKDLSMFEILLVEDNPINQMVAQQVLENWYAKVEFADDGLQAVEKLKQKDYSLVLMDLQMPVMNGYQATDFIRNKVNRVKNPDIPIIALTADAFPETKRKVLESGMNDFVTKPLEQNDLYNKIKLHALELIVVK